MSNLFCELSNCASEASVFGLRPNNTKEKYCSQHASVLASKGMSSYPVSGYHLISSYSDVPIFEERKAQVNVGLANLTVLQASCDSELSAVLLTLEAERRKIADTVERHFADFVSAATSRCDHVKEALQGIANNIEELLTSRDAKLLPSAQLLCSELTHMPRFIRFALADVSGALSSFLAESWSIATADVDSSLRCLDARGRKKMMRELRAEADSQAARGLSEAYEYLRDLGYADRAQRSVVKNPELRREPIQREQPLETADRLNNTGLLLSDLQRWGEAEDCLKHACALYSAAAPESIAAANNLYNLGRLEHILKRYQEAEDSYDRARRIYAVAAPQSKESALASYNLGLLYYEVDRTAEAELCYRQADKAFEVAAPQSRERASNLRELGLLLYDQRQWDEAEQSYQRARDLYQAAAPQCVEAADNLCNLGLLYKLRNCPADAEACYRRAQAIYLTAAPDSLKAALNYCNLGLLLSSTGQPQQAEDSHREAERIYEMVAPLSVAAGNNLCSMGALLYDERKWKEAEQYHRRAAKIYHAAAPRSIEEANNFYNLGMLFEVTGRKADAIGMYDAARGIYAHQKQDTWQANAARAVARLRS